MEEIYPTLCVPKDPSSLLVWNPYLGETIWIQTRKTIHTLDIFAFGYDNNNNNRNHKISWFASNYGNKKGVIKNGVNIYDFSSSSWRVLDVKFDWDIDLVVSLKGNTYFLCQVLTHAEDYLLCFDFTTERFGQRLPLPCNCLSYDLTLSCVRDEKLAVLCQHNETNGEIIEIWITTKIEPNAVLWSKFLKLDMALINGSPDDFLDPTSFFIDEEKKHAVLFDIDVNLSTSEKLGMADLCALLMSQV